MPDEVKPPEQPAPCRHWVVTAQVIGLSEAEARALYDKIEPLLPEPTADRRLFAMGSVEHYGPPQLERLVVAARAHAIQAVEAAKAHQGDVEIRGSGAAELRRRVERRGTAGSN